MAEQFTGHGSMRQAGLKTQPVTPDEIGAAVSIMPFVPRGNTNLSVMMIPEKLSAALREETENAAPKNHLSAALFGRTRRARSALLHCRKCKPFDFAAAMAITAADLALKGRLLGGYSLKAERVRRPRAEGYGPHPGGSGIMPAGITTGVRGASL